MSLTVQKKVSIQTRMKSLRGHFKRCTVKEVHPHIKFVFEDKMDIWYFMMGCMIDSNNEGGFPGNADEFIGGQFFGKITATDVYPYGPPDVVMLTPTNIFPLNDSDFCIDMGKYHADNYPPTIGMDGYTAIIWSGLIGWRDLGRGINLISGSQDKHVKMIRKASMASQQYNRIHNPHLVELFRDI
jgi:hypothetical protein